MISAEHARSHDINETPLRMSFVEGGSGLPAFHRRRRKAPDRLGPPQAK
jgi:hypothetical protein